MTLRSISFSFTQQFPFPAADVFAWATNYDPEDIALMGHKGVRKVRRIGEHAYLLDDTFEQADGHSVKKQKLVRLSPAQWVWTNTHLSGPSKHSQFLYRLVAETKNTCRLEFTGMQLTEIEDGPNAEKKVASLVRKLEKEDSAVWRRLARAVASDFKKAQRSNRR
jgi:hypothetical protein